MSLIIKNAIFNLYITTIYKGDANFFNEIYIHTECP